MSSLLTGRHRRRPRPLQPRSRRSRAVLAVGIAATALGLLLAGAPVRADATTSGAVILHGTMTDAAGRPLAGTVTVLGEADGWQSAVEFDRGEYAVEVAPGNYKLRYTAPGFETEYYNDAHTSAGATWVTAGETPVELDAVALAQGPAVRGLVRTPGGNLASGTAYAYLLDVPGEPAPIARPFDSAKSDVLFTDLATGTYAFRFETASSRFVGEFYNDATDVASATPVTVTESGAVLAPVELVERPTIRGFAVDSRGNAVDGSVEVHRRQPDGGYAYVAAADISWGHYELPVDPGTYQLRFGGLGYTEDGAPVYLTAEWYDGGEGAADRADAAELTVTAAGLELAPVTLAVPPAAATTDIKGRVVDSAGAGVGTVYVEVRDSAGSRIFNSAYTRPDGSFRVVLPMVGSYTVRFADLSGRFRGEWYDDQPDGATAEPVAVDADGTTLPAPVVLSRGATVSGRVTDANGAGLRDVDVQLVAVDDEAIEATTTHQDGTYAVTQVPPGSYKVLFADPLEQFRDEYLGDTVLWQLAETITVTGEETLGGRNAVLAAATDEQTDGTDLTGMVRDDAGRPIRGVTVAAYSVETMESPAALAVTDARGRYRFLDLDRATPRGYKLWFEPAWGNPAPTELVVTDRGWLGGKRFAGASPTLRVVRGETVTADQVLRRAGGITGRLVTDEGPARFGLVVFRDANGEYLAEATADPEGRFSVNELPAGAVYLQAMDDSHDDVWYGGGYGIGSSVSVPVRSGAFTPVGDILLTDRVVALAAPAVAGVPAVGRQLTAATGRWNAAGPDLAVEWLRGTTVVGTGSSYRVSPGDAGHQLRVRVTAVFGDRSGVALSAPTALVPTAARATRATVAATGRSARKRTAALRITVRAAGVARPGGSLTVRDGGKVVARAAVEAPTMTLTLRRQRKGKHHYTVAYSGSRLALAASTTVTVKVR